MRKMYGMMVVGSLLGTMFASACAVSAQNVTVVGEPCPLPVMASRPDAGETDSTAEGTEDAAVEGQTAENQAVESQADGSAESLAEAPYEDTSVREVTSFVILGRAGDDLMLILTPEAASAEEGAPADDGADVSDGAAGGASYEEAYVRIDDLQSLLPEIDCAAFPDLDGMEAVPVGSQGEGAELVQRVLAEQGLLAGAVDGKYGAGTAEAVRQFQTAHGLEATGSADEKTMLLINGILQGIEDSIEVTYPSYTTPEEKFRAIFGQTDADLDAFMDTGWRFSFDAFEDAGVIDPGAAIGTFAVEGADIDRISGTLSVKVQVAKNTETGYYDLIPVLAVETSGAYRPYLQGAVLAGGKTVKLEGGTSSGQVEGTALTETGIVPLTKEAVEQLKEGQVTTIRVLGKNTNYDVDVNAEGLAGFMEACEGLA